MTRRTSGKVAGLSGTVTLTLFPIDESSVQRLAQIVTPDQIQENRLTTIVAIMALLEPLFKDLDRMESLAETLNPRPPDLIKAITETRETVKQFYVLLADSFRST